MDKASFGGVLLAVVGIVAGLLIEGGQPRPDLPADRGDDCIRRDGGRGYAAVSAGVRSRMRCGDWHRFSLLRRDQNLKLIQQLVGFANKARRSGVVSLDADIKSVREPFLRQALTLAVDGSEPAELRKIMSLTQDARADGEDRVPAVFESAGGFSPTIGILGAVLGLIQVMQHLDKIEEVGRGIAVAFVATIYGVGAANLFFLPAAGKLRIRIREEQQRREIMLEGVISILEGINPRMLEVKLSGFLEDAQQASGKEGCVSRRAAPASHGSHERWLVSYADFITLLFAFFVVLYASSKADQKKQKQVSQAIDSAFHMLGLFPQASSHPANLQNVSAVSKDQAAPGKIVMGEEVLSPARVKQDLDRVQREMEQMLSDQIADHTVAIKMGKDGLVISLREAGVFLVGVGHSACGNVADPERDSRGAEQDSLRSAHRGSYGQCSDSQPGVRLQLGNCLQARSTRLARIFIGTGGHCARPDCCCRVCGVSPGGCERK